MKNVNEILTALGAGLEAGSRIAEDGKLGVDDFGHVFGVITKAAPAVKDAKEVFPELAKATNLEMDASAAVFASELKSFTPENKHDMANIEQGVFAVMRIIARAKEEGRAEGRAELAAQIKSGKISTKDL